MQPYISVPYFIVFLFLFSCMTPKETLAIEAINQQYCLVWKDKAASSKFLKEFHVDEKDLYPFAIKSRVGSNYTEKDFDKT